MVMTSAAAAAASRARVARRLGLVVAIALLVALGVGWTRLFIVPGEPSVGQTDVVVVLAGGEGERLRTALELLDAGVTDTLAISNGTRHGWARANELCDDGGSTTVICFQPRPGSTAGEARTVAELARTHGWQHVTVVTSTYHVLRSRVAFGQCLDTDLALVPAGFGPRGLAYNSQSVLREMVALPAMVTVKRAC